jgi:hypothetical protein
MTFEEAKALKPGTVLYSCIAAGYKDKRPLRARVNGVPQTWKTRPNEVRVPMKYGPRTTFQLHEDRPRTRGGFLLARKVLRQRYQNVLIPLPVHFPFKALKGL